MGEVLSDDPILSSSTQDRRKAIGESVTWSKLISGLYYPNARSIENGIDSLKPWMASIKGFLNSQKLPIFWIDGRSGEGKSVLLLQLAHAIATINQDVEYYHSVRPNSLLPLIEHVNAHTNNDLMKIFVVDDLHKIENYRDFDIIIDAYINNSNMQFAIITCGPTLEKEIFERNVRNSLIHSYNPTSWTQYDRNSLGEWFDLTVPKTAKDQDQLLIETLYEMKEGKALSAFALSFKTRLEELGVFEPISTALCANRLTISLHSQLLIT